MNIILQLRIFWQKQSVCGNKILSGRIFCEMASSGASYRRSSDGLGGNEKEQRDWRNDRRSEGGTWQSTKKGMTEQDRIMNEGMGTSSANYQRHGGRRHSGRPRQDNPDVKLSKTLSYLLRHGAEREGFTFMKGGYLYVEDVLKFHQLRNFTVADVERVVANNDKQRYYMEREEESDKLKIRANQGHSVQVEQLDLQEIKSAEEFSTVIHGTYFQKWDSIKAQGLSRMGRTHIHCAPGVPGEDEVISGMRKSCTVIIFIDMEKALQDGIKFYISKNNVILTEGDSNGLLLPIYFKEVLSRKTGEKLLV